jgi:hypothetical protein
MAGTTSLIAEVTINGQLCPDFSIVSEKLVDVVVPPAFTTYSAAELNIVVLSSGCTSGARDHEILYDIGKHPVFVSGNAYLIQKWVRFLLMTKGTDREDPTAGCSLLRLAGQISSTGIEGFKTKIAMMHHECKKQILERQMLEPRRANKAEILRDAILQSIDVDESGALIVETLLVDGNGTNLTISTQV